MVRAISPTEFSLAFPSATLLQTVSWFGTTTLPVYNIKVSIAPSSIDPDSTSTLSSVWVRIHEVPSQLKGEPIVRLIARTIGVLQEVDGDSLPGEGPLRLCVRVLDVDRLAGVLPPIYFDGVGRLLYV